MTEIYQVELPGYAGMQFDTLAQVMAHVRLHTTITPEAERRALDFFKLGGKEVRLFAANGLADDPPVCTIKRLDEVKRYVYP